MAVVEALEAHWEVMEVVATAAEVVEEVVVSPPLRASFAVEATSDHDQQVVNVCFVVAGVAMISGE